MTNKGRREKNTRGKVSFKIKVLLPILAIFIVSDLIISFINYRLLDSSVKTKTNANMEIFADSTFGRQYQAFVISYLDAAN